MKRYTSIIILLVILLFSSLTTIQPQEQNFDIKLIFSSDNIVYDSIAQTIKQQLNPLLININIAGSPQPVFLNELTEYDFDMAILSLDTVSNNFPPLWYQLSPESYTGSTIYRLTDNIILNSINTSSTQSFFEKIDLYHNSSTLNQKIKYAHDIQEEYNEHWVLDIPLISTSTLGVNWNEFEKFDFNEGIINSLFLGAKWNTNPSERINQDRNSNEIHYALYNFQQLNNPIYYQGRDGFLSLQSFFSSAFLTDKNNQLHPNLVKSFEDINHDDGTNSFILNIRDDITWSDGENLDANDFKFTYDLVSSNWIGATNYNDWKNLVSINVINQTQLQITFKDQSIQNAYHLANQYIIPEHVLNTTFSVNGIDFHPYDGYSPFKSELWQNFLNNPTTSGPFLYDNINSKSNIVEIGTKNPNYWTPSILDNHNQIFNLTSNKPHTPYYFTEIDTISIENIIYHVSGSKNIDQNSLINSLQSGSRDIIEFPSLSSSEIFDQNKFQISSTLNSGGGIVILLNTYNSDLSNHEVRKAISKAINRDELSTLMGIGQLAQGNVISNKYTKFYNNQTEIKYNYEEARDDFRRLGYAASDSIFTNTEYTWPWQQLSFSNNYLIIGLIFITLYRKYNDKR